MAAFDAFIEGRLHGNTETRAENVAVDCPFCGRKSKLWIHRQSGLCQCFGSDCGYKGNAVRLVMDVEGISRDQAFLRVAHTLKDQVHTRLSNAEAASTTFCETLLRTLLKDQNEVINKSGTRSIELPKGSCAIRNTAGERYLKSRGFARQHYNKHNLQFCSKLKADRAYENHIVFPDYIPGTKVLRYWTTRAAFEPKHGPKSRNPPNVEKRGILYGESAAYRAQNDGTIVLVEGPMDVLALRGHAIALLGKTLSEEQCLRIVAQYKRVVVCLDRSAIRDALTVVEQLRSFGLTRCYLSHAEKDDPADAVKAGNTSVWKTIKENAEFVTLRVQMQVHLGS